MKFQTNVQSVSRAGDGRPDGRRVLEPALDKPTRPKAHIGKCSTMATLMLCGF